MRTNLIGWTLLLAMGARAAADELKWPGTGVVTQTSYSKDHDAAGNPIWPSLGHVYASRPEHRHWGLDIDLYAQASPTSSPDFSNVGGLGYVYAAGAGTAFNEGAGVVSIDHGNGMWTRYRHCSAIYVPAGGAWVAAGDCIAKEGNVGASTAPHLHFEILVNGAYQHFSPDINVYAAITKGQTVQPVFYYWAAGGGIALPGAPTGLAPSGTTVSTSPVTLNWSAAADADDHDVSIVVWLNGAWSAYFAGVTGSGAGSFTFTPSVANTSYGWWVRAHNGGGWGPWSPDGVAFAYAPSGPATPATPVIFTPSNGASFATSPVFVDWSDEAADYYEIDIYNGSGALVQQSWPASSQASISLGAAGPYTVQVWAHNSAGWSGAAQVAITFSPSVPTAPPAPTGLWANALSGTSVQFGWNGSAGADGYWLDIAQSPGDLSSQSGTFQNAFVGSATGATWNGLASGLTYYWRVWAYNGAGGNHGYPAGPVTTPSSLPPAPTGLAPMWPNAGYDVSGPSATLSWNPVAGADSHDVFVEVWDGSQYVTYYEWITGSGSSFTFWPSTSGTWYRWWVRAHTAAGWGEWSYVAPAGGAPGGGAEFTWHNP